MVHSQGSDLPSLRNGTLIPTLPKGQQLVKPEPNTVSLFMWPECPPARHANPAHGMKPACAPDAVSRRALLSADPVARATASDAPPLLPDGADGCHANPVQRSSCARTAHAFLQPSATSHVDSTPPHPAARADGGMMELQHGPNGPSCTQAPFLLAADLSWDTFVRACRKKSSFPTSCSCGCSSSSTSSSPFAMWRPMQARVKPCCC